jgi:hypothetical protein
LNEDSKYVHNIIQSLIVGEDAEQWVKDHKRSKNGRTDSLTFVAHFTKTKHMFHIFEEVGEPKPESAKIRNPMYRPTANCASYWSGHDSGPPHTFTTAANMIASQVTPKETNRSVSALGKESGDKVKTDFLPVKKW